MTFDNPKYISLQTSRKNGRTVETPLWAAQPPETRKDKILYAFTNEKSGKVKRIENNPSVKVALCSFNGKIQSTWFPATASPSSEEEEIKEIVELMYKKYSWQMLLVDVLARIGGRRSSWIVLKIIY